MFRLAAQVKPQQLGLGMRAGSTIPVGLRSDLRAGLALRSAFDHHAPKGAKLFTHASGMQARIEMPASMDCAAVLRAAKLRGVTLRGFAAPVDKSTWQLAWVENDADKVVHDAKLLLQAMNNAISFQVP